MKNGHYVAAALLAAAALGAAVLLFPQLPERVPTHWDWRGHINGWGPRWTVFVLPVVMALITGLFRLLPWLSPRRFEVDSFRSTYLYIMLTTIALLGYIHLLHLWAALHPPLQMGRALTGGLFVFLILTGNVLGKVRRNFWVGVRTPWTLADERVWDATHRFAARLFVGTGLLGLAVTLAGWPVAALALLGTAAVASAAYSLLYYKRLEQRREV
jgi:uncharacterized membrane protein